MEKEEVRSQIELGTAPLGGLMVKYAVPCVISLVVSALYNIVDQLFIANAAYLGSYGNAANTTVFPLVIICLAIAGMFGDGTNAYFTFCVGGGRTKDGKNAVGTSVTTIIILGILFLIIYNVFANPLLNAFGANVNEQTFANAKEYLFWISLGLPFYMLGQTLSPIICGDGSPRYAMITMLTGCAINIVFDPILIYVAKWGMKGAAIATIAGQIVVCILNVLYLRKMNNITMDAEGFKIRLEGLRQVIPLGMTSFFAQLSIVLSMAAVNNMLKIYGATDPIFCQEEYSQIPLAVVGLVFKFFQIIVSVAIGLTAGCVPIIGYNRGAGKYERLLELLNKILKAEIGVGIIAFVIFEGFAKQITYLFGAANESIYYQDFAVTCIRLFLSMVILSCVNKGVMIFLQGMGKAAQSTTISVVREIIGGVGLAILLPVLFGFDGILFFMPAAEILTFIFSMVFLVQIRRELKAGVAASVQTGSAASAEAASVSAQKGAAAASGPLQTGAASSASVSDGAVSTAAFASADAAAASSPGGAASTAAFVSGSVAASAADVAAAGIQTGTTAGAASGKPVGAPRTDMVITLGRSYGAGGRTVGRLLAQQLNIPYYDAAILEKAAESSGMDRKFLESMDEKTVNTKLLYQYAGYSMRSMEALSGIADQAQREIIERVADEGPCVIVGRRADQILRDRGNVINVFVTASEETRAARIAKREGLSEAESFRKVVKVDRERAAYYNQRSEREWGNAATYDLCLDTDKFGLEGTASRIAAMIMA